MKVLVAFATAHGSTQGIANRLVDGLRSHGLDVRVAELADLDSLTGYDAAVMGSAVHSGKWLPEASRLVARHGHELGETPVWLFSVSSIGDSSSFFPGWVASLLRKMRAENKEIAGFRKGLRVRGHRNFAGAIEKGDWGRGGDLFFRLSGGRFGDYRDWADVDAWADSIVLELQR